VQLSALYRSAQRVLIPGVGSANRTRPIPDWHGARPSARRLARKLARVAVGIDPVVELQLLEAPVMSERSWVGLDVHARSVVAGAIKQGSGEVRSLRVPPGPAKTVEWLQTLPTPVRAVLPRTMRRRASTDVSLIRAARSSPPPQVRTAQQILSCRLRRGTGAVARGAHRVRRRTRCCRPEEARVSPNLSSISPPADITVADDSVRAPASKGRRRGSKIAARIEPCSIGCDSVGAPNSCRSLNGASC
jgi:hypothetical protein